MKTRTLGKSGRAISELGFGAMGMSFGLGPAKDKKEMIALLMGGRIAGLLFLIRRRCMGRL